MITNDCAGWQWLCWLMANHPWANEPTQTPGWKPEVWMHWRSHRSWWWFRHGAAGSARCHGCAKPNGEVKGKMVKGNLFGKILREQILKGNIFPFFTLECFDKSIGLQLPNYKYRFRDEGSRSLLAWPGHHWPAGAYLIKNQKMCCRYAPSFANQPDIDIIQHIIDQNLQQGSTRHKDTFLAVPSTAVSWWFDLFPWGANTCQLFAMRSTDFMDPLFSEFGGSTWESFESDAKVICFFEFDVILNYQPAEWPLCFYESYVSNEHVERYALCSIIYK